MHFTFNQLIGLTQLNPNMDVTPKFAVPDLSNGGTSWVFSIGKPSPCGPVKNYPRRLRNKRCPNSANVDASTADNTKPFYPDDDNDENDDEDDTDSENELKSTGS